MRFRFLSIIFMLVLFGGCAFGKPTNSNIEAILQLDTGGHSAKIRKVLITKSGDLV